MRQETIVEQFVEGRLVNCPYTRLTGPRRYGTRLGTLFQEFGASSRSAGSEGRTHA